MDPALDSVKHYLISIGRIPLLTSTEEIQLGQAIQKQQACITLKEQAEAEGQSWSQDQWAAALGCTEAELVQMLAKGSQAKDKMVSANLRLVFTIAKKYEGQGMELLDLIQEGSLGLMRGAEKFDPSKGYKFSTYAYWWITQAIRRGIADKKGTIRLPNHINDQLVRLKKVSRQFNLDYGRYPTLEELSQLLNIPTEKLLTMVSFNRPLVSLDSSVDEQDNESCLGDFIADPQQDLAQQLETLSSKEEMKELLADLTEIERGVITRRYLINEPQTYRAISEALGINRETARQVHKKALRKLQIELSNSLS